MAGNHRSSTLPRSAWRVMPVLGMAGNHRSSTLSPGLIVCPLGWGWPGITAQVHCLVRGSDCRDRWGWPGITAQVHFDIGVCLLRKAGDGRESPLKYTTHTTLR